MVAEKSNLITYLKKFNLLQVFMGLTIFATFQTLDLHLTCINR